MLEFDPYRNFLCKTRPILKCVLLIFKLLAEPVPVTQLEMRNVPTVLVFVKPDTSWMQTVLCVVCWKIHDIYVDFTMFALLTEWFVLIYCWYEIHVRVILRTWCTLYKPYWIPLMCTMQWYNKCTYHICVYSNFRNVLRVCITSVTKLYQHCFDWLMFRG